LQAAPSVAPPPTATEVVTRPEPGLARGRWEAPAYAFWIALALIFLGSAAYVLWRMGAVRLRRPAKEKRS
jgi:hypothetical protein